VVVEVADAAVVVVVRLADAAVVVVVVPESSTTLDEEQPVTATAATKRETMRAFLESIAQAYDALFGPLTPTAM
jgi:hypothetical protein